MMKCESMTNSYAKYIQFFRPFDARDGIRIGKCFLLRRRWTIISCDLELLTFKLRRWRAWFGLYLDEKKSCSSAFSLNSSRVQKELLTVDCTMLTSCHIWRACWRYKSVYFIVTCQRTINKAINDLRKRLNSTRFGRWCTFWAYYVK